MTQTSTPAARPVLLADEIVVQDNTENPDSYYVIELVLTDDNPSLVGTVKISENQAERLMRQLADKLGYTIA